MSLIALKLDTDCLRILPSEAEIMGNVVALFGGQS